MSTSNTLPGSVTPVRQTIPAAAVAVRDARMTAGAPVHSMRMSGASPSSALGSMCYVPLLDAALGVAAVTAHVPLAGSASNARLRVGPTHDANDEIAGREAAPLRRRLDRAQRFMAENKALITRRSKPIATVENFAIGPAHSECQGAHQDGA